MAIRFVIVFVCVLLIVSTSALEEAGAVQDPDRVQTFHRNNVVARTIRSGPDNSSCITATKTVDVILSSSVRTITCNCSALPNATITWKDKHCKALSSSSLTFIQNNTLTFIKEESRERTFYCTSGPGCVYRITASQAEPGISLGVQGFLVFLIVFISLILGYFVVKRFRNPVYLCCRDACAASNANDGKEFDAFISVGKNASDLKYIEKNIVDILQVKYGYDVIIHEENLLPRLDYSEVVQSKMHKCRRLVVVFTPAYMTNEWCMYCLSEGLRKLLELNVEMIFIVSDLSILGELNSLRSLVGHVPKILMPLLPMAQNIAERDRVIEKIRLHMPPSRGRTSTERGMRAPMLNEAEDIDQRSINDNGSYGGTEYTFGRTEGRHKGDVDMDDISNMNDDELQYDEEDPASIRVNHYGAKKDFFRIAMVD